MKLKAGIYKHFKGNLYEVLDVARHSETEEEFVVYKPLDSDSGTWIRPLSMFDEIIERDGQKIKRFAFLKDSQNNSGDFLGNDVALTLMQSKCYKL